MVLICRGHRVGYMMPFVMALSSFPRLRDWDFDETPLRFFCE